MPTLLFTGEISWTWPYFVKMAPTIYCSSEHHMQSNPVSIYSVCTLTYLAVRVLPANALSSSSDVSRMSHISFDLLTHTFTAMLRDLSASSITSLLTLDIHKFSVFFYVSKEIILLVIASNGQEFIF